MYCCGTCVVREARKCILGETGGVLKLKLRSPPVDGAANAELIRLLAKHFGVARSAVEIISGHASRTKRLRIASVAAESCERNRDVL
ncbi:MAG: DUF167 domain-containing protein [Pyrinomonadaceae bacterium]